MGVLFVILLLPELTKVPDVTIPDVSNLTEAEAANKLKKLNLEVSHESKEEASEEIAAGKVIGTNPVIGRQVKEGTKVTLIVSTGIKTYLVIDFTGKNYIEVKTELEKMYKIDVEVLEKEIELNDKKEYDEQEIIAQSLEPGTILKAKDKITLYIPKIEERYPDIVGEGWSISQAQSWAEEKEIVLKIEYKETNDYAEGTIISQSRGTDSVVVKGVDLKIVVATAPSELPDDNEGSVDSDPDNLEGNN